VPQNANDSKYHSSEIAVGIPDEDSRRVPVVPPQGHGDADEGKKHIQGEKMGVGGRMWIWHNQVKAVVEDKEECNNQRLRYLDAIDSSQNVNAVWAEYCHRGHVNVVEEA